MDAAGFIDETTPLLPGIEACESAPRTQTPLQRGQLAILCAVRLTDPITFTQIFPYINEFLTSLNLVDDDSQIGFYSGLVESSFALFQLLFIYQWARISDSIGRRPVIIAGTVGLAVSTVLFGVTTNLSQLLLARCLAGSLSGIAAVLHSVLGEITDQSNQAIAYPIYGLFWPLGSIIGPLIGGMFANPTDQYPHIFGSIAFLKRYPYFLPCFLSGFFTLLTAIAAYFFLHETLVKGEETENKINPTESHSTDTQPFSNSTAAPTNIPTATHTHTEPHTHPDTLTHDARLYRHKKTILAAHMPNATIREMGMRDLFSVPIIGALCLSGCALCFVATAFDAVFVLFAYTSMDFGGLSFNTSQIGYALAIAGASSILIQILLLPTLLRRFSHAKLYNFFIFLWPFTFALLPLLHITMTSRSLSFSSRMALVWTEIVFLMAISRFGCLAYSVSLILCKDHAPGPAALAKTNGLVLLGMCIARAIAPAFISSLFAWSIKSDVLGGYLWIVIMIIICMLSCSLSNKIANPKGYHGPAVI